MMGDLMQGIRDRALTDGIPLSVHSISPTGATNGAYTVIWITTITAR